jgi:hypothetical protein
MVYPPLAYLASMFDLLVGVLSFSCGGLQLIITSHCGQTKPVHSSVVVAIV